MKKTPVVNEGLKDVENGRVVSNAAMISWLSSWGDDDEQHAPPCPESGRGEVNDTPGRVGDFGCEGDDR